MYRVVIKICHNKNNNSKTIFYTYSNICFELLNTEKSCVFIIKIYKVTIYNKRGGGIYLHSYEICFNGFLFEINTKNILRKKGEKITKYCIFKRKGN